MKKIKYVIVSPRQKYGGAVVLHLLCKTLQDLGYNSSIYYSGASYYKKGHRIKFWIKHIIFLIKDLSKIIAIKTFGEEHFAHNEKYAGYVNLSVKGCKRKLFPIVDENTVVVYPDVVYGNYFRAKNVVRWFLYYNRYSSDAYGKNDLFFCYRDVFNDEKLNPLKRKLYLEYFDLNLYKNVNTGKRQGTCYIVRKGALRKDLPSKYEGIVIDNLSEMDKVRTFNESQYCISYDLQTAYSHIAALCGCISIVIPEEGKTWKDYYPGEKRPLGVAFGFSEDEIAYAKNTMHLVKKNFEEKNNKCKYSVQEFAKVCKEYFKIE
ncbi:hypothetical protein KQI22_01705 [Kineothrix sp. MSJ-39]|uniref:hypothetical protein n=1 Tax=Kineothrix sp. MSJ-39 TaxID=2841533 RepID=UPI001C11B81A|nr:hypothetical protein [Kineothrix sp. MSJ-39]MBU5428781.1 hypothetical protein [Kineothrix sp. MSJ-39]